MENGGKFRKKKTNFSIVSNTIARDKNISLKAKGLYLLIQSYITIDNFTLYKSFLQSQSCEGVRAFDSAWNELKETGYLKQYKMREGSNRFYYEYELLDEPEKEIPQDIRSLVVQNVGVENEDLQNVGGTKCESINNTIYNNTLQNNNISNHIISIQDVMDQIGYETFNKVDLAQVNEIVMLITEVLNTPDDKTLHIARNETKTIFVKQRFKSLNQFHIEYVLECLKQNMNKISNVKNYLLTTLYNAPLTMDTYYQNKMLTYESD